MLLFNLLNNVLFYTDYDSNGNYKYSNSDNLTEEKKMLEDEINKYDYNKESDVSLYVDLKTKLDVITLKEKYQINTWQYNKVNDYLYNILENINIYTYQIKDNILLKELEEQLEKLLIKFDEGNWKYFANNEIFNLENEIFDLEKKLDISTQEYDRQEITKLINNKNKELKILKYRLENNITYDNSYLNNSLSNYISNLEMVEYYEKKINNLSFVEKQEYQNIKENLEMDKYILENKQNYNKQNNLNYQLRTIVDDYEIFIIIIVLLTAGTIVAEEFRDGTIKLLLIKPYSRGKILLSKYLATIIFMMLVILYLILLQLLIGGYIFGFSSLKLAVIVYNFNSGAIVEYNVFIYMIIRIITKLPMIIMILTISFSISTIINNVASSITIPLFIYVFSSSINYLILQYNIIPLKYLVNVNWNFNNYLFGKIGEIEGINLKSSLVIFGGYFVAIAIITYINFKKKNIRNV